MQRRDFVKRSLSLGAGLAIAPHFDGYAAKTRFSHRLPKTDGHYKVTAGYIEDDPIPAYHWASDTAYESFLDMKFGIRLHWGLYSIFQQPKESWQFLDMSLEERQAYQSLYKSWNPVGFDADTWVNFFADSGARMFSFTTKHHDGFSMYDTKTRVQRRVNWLGESGPTIEACDRAYSIMETPFGRDVTAELCRAARRRKLDVDLYFSHPDWYDADFRPYNYHPLQVPSASKLAVRGNEPEMAEPAKRFAKAGLVMKADPSPEEVSRMLARHRSQLEEIITRYGEVKMVCLDQWLGPTVWPQLRDTLLYLRKLRPDVMYRARGIGNYGDYYTPEGFVPGNKENTDTPWFVIYPLGYSFSYDPNPTNYKGTSWVIENLVDSAAKGGNFMVGIGPDGNGEFHPKAVDQLLGVGRWLSVHGTAIYGTRARSGDAWREGDTIRFTQSKDGSTLYAFTNQCDDLQLRLATVQTDRVSSVRLMGYRNDLKWSAASNGELRIDIPADALDCLPDACKWMKCFEITLTT